MVLEFFRGSTQSGLDEVQETLVQMLQQGHEVFTTSTDALFGGGKSKETKQEVKSTDKEINEAQQAVRRQLMVSAAISSADLPLGALDRPAEGHLSDRGDYAKNIYDLVKYGADFDAAPDRYHLLRYRDAVGQLILDAAGVFEAKDAERAQRLIGKADAFLDEYDAQVKAAYQSQGSASDAVARALYFRFLKRTTAHVMNVLTALVQPLDRLDYYDEAKDDR